MGRIMDKLRTATGFRPIVQLVLVLALNFSVIGSFAVLPLLPMLRLDLPVDIGASGQKVCTFGNLEREMSFFWPIQIALLVVAVFFVIGLVFGRALCGWGCSIGLLQDGLTYGRQAARRRPLEPSKRTHRLLGYLRYALLLFIVVFSLSLGVEKLYDPAAGGIVASYLPAGTAQVAPYCAACPTPSIYYVTNTLLTGNPKFSDPLSFVAIFVFIALIAGAVAVPRFFCRYFCPVGALASPFNKVSLLSIRKDPKTAHSCTACNYCASVCPQRVEGVREAVGGARVNAAACDLCLRCVDACPEKALSLNFAGKRIYSGGKHWWLKDRRVKVRAPSAPVKTAAGKRLSR